jgi:hypothetical protein
MPKFAFSRTLKRADWNAALVVGGADLAAAFMRRPSRGASPNAWSGAA